MPRISMFYGLVVFMYYDDHAPPHFHVLYEGQDSSFDLRGALLEGTIASRAQRLVREWAQKHHDELLDDWRRQEKNLPLNWIEPLR